MKKIYLISEAYSSAHKGTAVHTHAIAKTLDNINSNYSYVLIVPKYPDSEEKYYLFDNIKIISIDINVSSDVGLLNKTARDEFISRVGSYLKEVNDIHIIHVLYGHYIHKAIENINTKKIWTCHNVPPNEYPNLLGSDTLGNKVVNYIYHKMVAIKHKKLIKNYTYDSIVAISSFTKREIRKFDQKIKIDIVGNGIHPVIGVPEKNLKNCQKKIKLLTIGGIKSHKCVHLIPSIAKDLAAKYEIEWNVIGPIVDKRYYDSFKEQVVTPVRFTGKLDQIELDRYLRETDIYVHTSNMEGFCLTALEANLSGIPVVGTNVGAIPEVITSNQSGVVCEPTRESLISGISYMINNIDQFDSREMSKNTIENWSWEVICRKLEDVYNGCR